MPEDCITTRRFRAMSRHKTTLMMKNGEALLVHKSQSLERLNQSSSGFELQARIRGSFKLTLMKHSVAKLSDKK